MKDLVLEYIEEIKQKKLSRNTLDAYGRDVNNFVNFIQERNENLLEIDIVSIMAYMQRLQKKGKASTSVIRSLISIRSFYKYLVKKKYIMENPTNGYDIPKVKRNIPKILTIEEVDMLLCSPECSNFKGIRDKTMLEVMYATGIKITELLNLSVYDINIKLSYITCKSGNNKERIVPLGSYAVECLKQYLAILPENNPFHSDLLFLNTQGSQMSRQGFWKIIKYYALNAGINVSINSYTLRHSFAVHLLQNGADLKSVQELLGHRGIAATQIYTAISKKNKVMEVYKKNHPRA